MLNRKNLGNAVVFAIGFMIPLALVGCGKAGSSLSKQMAGPAPLKMPPQPVNGGPLSVYQVTAAVNQSNQLSVSWEVGAGLNAVYDLWSCSGADGSTCSAWLVADCNSNPGTCVANDPNAGGNDLTSNNGPVQFSISMMQNGHQLITLTDSAMNSLPNTTIGVDAVDNSGNTGQTQYSY